MEGNLCKRWLGFMRYVLTITACVLCGGVHAQRLPFHNLGADDGLVQSHATCLAQDKAGNLWIGTRGGLSRYNGQTFTNYTVRNGMPSNVVYAVAADTQNNIWVGGTAGIAAYNGKTFVIYTIPGNSYSAMNASQQITVSGDTTWWRAQGSLYCIANGKITDYPAPGTGTLTAMLKEKDGLWIAAQDLVCHYQNNKWDTLKFALPAGQKTPEINHIFRDKAGSVWLTTDLGLYKAGNEQVTAYTIANLPFPAMPPLLSIAQDSAGALWLGTTGGVLKLSGKTIEAYNKHGGLSDARFPDLLTDAEGNVWMASDGQGIFRFSGSQFSVLDESAGLRGAQITAIAGNRRDSLYFATYDEGLYVFTGDKVTSLGFPANPAPVITALLFDKGRLWIGTHGKGLWIYQRHIFRQYIGPEHHFPSDNVTSLYAGPSGAVYIGFDNGISMWDNDKFSPVTDKSADVTSFLTIGADSLLIATENYGLQLYTAGLMQPFVTHTAADSAAVKCFILRGRNIWMGSDNGVISYNMDTDTTTIINKRNGLRSDYIYNIAADKAGDIWAGTGYGIHRIKMVSGVPQVTFYGRAQGISGMESSLNAVQTLPDGSIWFGTANGAVHYQPNTAVVLPAPVAIVLESVKVSGEDMISHSWYDSSDNWYGIPYHLHLPYDKNNISFTFLAVTLSGEQQMLYRYRMDGLETPWSDWSAANSVTYPALPQGKYALHVACRGSGGQTTPELVYEFEIVTPFQKTVWFRYVVLCTCILLGIFIQYVISNRKQRRMRLLEKLRNEELNKVRIRTAEDFHDEVGNKLTRINVLTDVLKNKIVINPESTRIIRQIQENTAQLYSGTRDILWSLQPANDSLYEILYHIRDFGNELFQDTDINFTFTGDDSRWRQYRLPMDMSRNLVMIFKEALNNALKHAGAKNVSLEAKWKSRGVLQLLLKDDGAGFDTHAVQKGNGLGNMQLRASRLNGRLYVDARKGKGTILNLTFKIPQNRG